MIRSSAQPFTRPTRRLRIKALLPSCAAPAIQRRRAVLTHEHALYYPRRAARSAPRAVPAHEHALYYPRRAARSAHRAVPAHKTAPRDRTRPSRIQRPSRRSSSQNRVSRPHTSKPPAAPIASFRLTAPRIRARPSRIQRSSHRSDSPCRIRARPRRPQRPSRRSNSQNCVSRQHTSEPLQRFSVAAPFQLTNRAHIQAAY